MSDANQNFDPSLSPEEIKLRFFRDLADAERIKVFQVFGVLPRDFGEAIALGIQRQLYPHLLSAASLGAKNAAEDHAQSDVEKWVGIWRSAMQSILTVLQISVEDDVRDGPTAVRDRFCALEAELATLRERAGKATADAEEAEVEVIHLGKMIHALAAALEPFADIDGEGDMDFPDDTVVRATYGRTTDTSLKLGHFRTARRVWNEADKLIDEKADDEERAEKAEATRKCYECGSEMTACAQCNPDLQAAERSVHVHRERGTLYRLIGFGKMQTEHWRDPNLDEQYDSTSVDMREVAIYRSANDGSLWVRPREEFEDGRFVLASSMDAPDDA